MRTVEPRFEEIDAELATIADLREKPAGTIRITATEYAIQSVLVPKPSKLLREYPDIKIEMVVDFGLTDIVAERYDAGVRSGEQVEKDMIAVRIGPNLRMAVAGAPSYFKNRSEPKKPQDLSGTIASICACPGMTISMPGSSTRTAARSGCVKGSSPSMPHRSRSMPRLPGSGWSMHRKACFSPISPGEGCGGCLRIGASPIPATTSSIQAGGSPQQRFPWWSMRCDTGRDMATVPSGRTQEMLDGEAFGLGTERSTFAAQRLRLLSGAIKYVTQPVLGRPQRVAIPRTH